MVFLSLGQHVQALQLQWLWRQHEHVPQPGGMRGQMSSPGVHWSRGQVREAEMARSL